MLSTSVYTSLCTGSCYKQIKNLLTIVDLELAVFKKVSSVIVHADPLALA